MARTQLYPPSVDPGFPELLETPKGWTRTTFGNALTVIERPAKLAPETSYQLVTAKRNRGGIVSRGFLLGSEVLTKTQFVVREGDFLISRRQIIHGACGVVPAELDNAVVSNEYSTLRTQPQLLMDFLRHYSHTKYFQRTCFHSSHGVDVEKMIFKIEQWLKFPVDIPPISEQGKIVSILASLDHAIESTRAVIDQLGVVKKALMAELLTRGIPGRHTKFKQTEIGEMPEAWTTTTYGELAADIPSAIQSGPFGSSLRHSEFTDRGRLIIGIDNVLDGRFSSGASHRISEEKFQSLRKFQARPLDLLITVMATVGRCCVVPPNIEPSIITKHVYRLTVDRARANPYFLMYCMYGLERLSNEVRGSAHGLTRAGLNKTLLLPLRFPLPSLPEQDQIVSILGGIDERLQTETESLTGYSLVKSALMFVLLTGEIRVPPAEQHT